MNRSLAALLLSLPVAVPIGLATTAGATTPRVAPACSDIPPNAPPLLGCPTIPPVVITAGATTTRNTWNTIQTTTTMPVVTSAVTTPSITTGPGGTQPTPATLTAATAATSTSTTAAPVPPYTLQGCIIPAPGTHLDDPRYTCVLVEGGILWGVVLIDPVVVKR